MRIRSQLVKVGYARILRPGYSTASATRGLQKASVRDPTLVQARRKILYALSPGTVARLPLFALPLFALPLFALPLFALPLFALPLFALPLFALPLFALPLFALPLFALPLFARDADYASVAGGNMRALDCAAEAAAHIATGASLSRESRGATATADARRFEQEATMAKFGVRQPRGGQWDVDDGSELRALE